MYHQVRALQRMILQTTAVVEGKKETAHLKTRPTLKVVHWNSKALQNRDDLWPQLFRC